MLDHRFIEAVRPLMAVGMGTEHVALLLYSLIRMTRPHSVLEVGLGYTTPFILKALADNAEEWEVDLACLQSGRSMDVRRDLLLPAHFLRPYQPKLVAIDDFSVAGSTATRVLEVTQALGLDDFLVQITGDFRGCSATIDEQHKPFGFIWFDCGGPEEYVEFLKEYWNLSADNSLLALHFTYQWQEITVAESGNKFTDVGLAPGPVLKELRRQHQLAGVDAGFEILSVVESHKTRQGSVTLLRRHRESTPVSPEFLAGSFRVTR